MLIHDFLKLFQNAPKWARVNVESVTSYGLDYQIQTPPSEDVLCEIASLKDDINTNEGIIRNLEKEKEDLQKSLETTEKLLEEARKTLDSYQISPTETLQELIDRCETQEEQINNHRQNLQNFHKNQLDLTQEIKELRARKNKATIERDYNTGQFVAEFQGAKYFLVKQQ